MLQYPHLDSNTHGNVQRKADGFSAPKSLHSYWSTGHSPHPHM